MPNVSKRWPALLAALLAAALLLAACMPMPVAEVATPTPEPTAMPTPSPTPAPGYVTYEPKDTERADVKLPDVEYVRPTLEAFEALTDPFFEAFAAAETAQEQIRLYVELDRATRPFGDMETLANVNFMTHVSPETQEERDLCTDFMADILPISVKVYETLLNSPYQEEIKAYFGEDVLADMRMTVDEFVPEIAELSRQISRLSSEYTSIVNDHTNQGIVIDEIAYSSADVEQAILWLRLAGEQEQADYYDDALTAYYEERNRLCDEVYVQMLDLRTQVARLAGYESYPEYAFSGGSYTYEDVQEFLVNLKETLLPIADGLYEQAMDATGDASDPYRFYIAMCPAAALVEPTYLTYEETPEEADQKEYDVATAVLRELSPETAELIDYLEEYELIDVYPSEEKSAGGFSTYLYGLQEPYIFSDDVEMSTIIHESGHALNSFYFPWIDVTERFNMGTEIAEVHSMALEMLVMEQYDDLYGETADLAVMQDLYMGVVNILTQAMFCEFEIELYENQEMTREDRAQLYSDLRAEYRQNIPGIAVYDDSGANWVDVLHFFESPLYTIDYSIAQTISFEIWNESQEDPAAAMETYMSFLRDNTELDLQPRLANAGLSNPFDRALLEELGGQLGAILTDPAYMEPYNTVLEMLEG